MTENVANEELFEWVVRIVAAQVSRNAMPAAELPALIRVVHDALAGLGNSAPPDGEPKPAVPIKRSVTPDYIICLEDGRRLKMLKRHLKTAYGMTPEEYRARWGLPADYPMVAPKYASQRSSLAKRIGLGRRPK
jgi:predicted transcriptional regulator